LTGVAIDVRRLRRGEKQEGQRVTRCMTTVVSDHRGSNSQAIDFESIKIYSIFTVKIENSGKSNT
jgi:hypothetical protein